MLRGEEGVGAGDWPMTRRGFLSLGSPGEGVVGMGLLLGLGLGPGIGLSLEVCLARGGGGEGDGDGEEEFFLEKKEVIWLC